MVLLKDKIIEFLKIEKNDGSGSGYGYGSGSGSGYGYGDGDGSGSGYGYGCGYGISKINDYDVYIIDRVQTIISNIKNNYAKGFILRKDLTLEPCFVIKANNLFAHGKTLREAQVSLNEKLFEGSSTEERIDMFLDNFEKDKTYKGSVFFDWHNKLTGSCLMGRESFVRDNGLSVDDEYTVDEFINLTLNSYGGEIIKELKDRW